MFDYTAAAGQNTAELAITGSLNGASIVDSGGNPADLSSLPTAFNGSYSSPGIQDAALLSATTHRMIEAMASFDTNPAGMLSPLVSSHQPTISDYLAIGSPGHHGG